MLQSQRHPVARAAVALCVLLAAVVALAQWQVNTQVGQVNNRVGGELYGNNNIGSVRYSATPQQNLLPSEARYATWRSGALPSEIAMNAAAVGPLAPNGAISYVPKPSPLQTAMKTPQPPLYTNNYSFAQPAKTDQLLPPPQKGYAPSSIRYSNPPPPPAPPVNTSTGQVPTRNIPPPVTPSAPSVSLQPTYVEALNSGSMRYSDPPKN